jgi:hypothetical protein
MHVSPGAVFLSVIEASLYAWSWSLWVRDGPQGAARPTCPPCQASGFLNDGFLMASMPLTWLTRSGTVEIVQSVGRDRPRVR